MFACLPQNSVCGFGKVRDEDVRLIAEKVLVAWGVATVVSRRGRDSPSCHTLDASMRTCLRWLDNTQKGVLIDELRYELL